MKYLLQRNGWYSYSRQVPAYMKDFDAREKVRISLQTKCPKTAMKKAIVFNDEVEQYWNSLIQDNQSHQQRDFKDLVQLSKQLGFRYIPAIQLAKEELPEIISRLQVVKKADNEMITSAVLGKETPKAILISEALNRFWDYSKHVTLAKTSNQQRKWKNPRIRTVKNFIKYVGDKPINEITNLDMIKMRDWWVHRMSKENIRASTVNKEFIHLKGVIETVATREQIDINIEGIFKKIHLREEDKGQRNSFETKFIKDVIIPKIQNCNHLDKESRYILYALIGTGARPIELLNLDGENDILLDHPIPHIHIRPRQGYSLKTKQSDRKIPLVGYALEAFKTYPKGFHHYKGKPDQFSTYINAYLSGNDLRPTQKHSLYSFRHSFQDRLTANEIRDRVQCQLMGHKFNRPTYGKGASLDQLLDVLGKVNSF